MNEEVMEFDEELRKCNLFYSEALRQYKLEMDSYNILTDKANNLLTAVGTIITLLTIALIQIVLNNISINSLILIFSLIIPYGCLIYSLLCSIESYRVSELITIDPQSLVEEYYDENEIKILKQLISNISSDLHENKLITEKRTKLINNSLKSLKLGLISLIIIVILYLIIYFLLTSFLT